MHIVEFGLFVASISLQVSAAGPYLPPQPDLDLPVLPDTYHPDRLAPVPPTPDEGRDPRDEPVPIFYGEEIASESQSLVYVIDLSGSMDYGTRLETAREQFRRSVSALAPSFRFNVIVFDCAILAWSPSTRPATPEHKAQAIGWVEALVPQGGGTATGPAVAKALEEKENLAVVLLTDGDPNCGANFHDGHRAMIRAANTQRATISVFGIDAWGDYRAFCQAVAAESGGAYVDVTTPPPPTVDSK